MIWAWHFLNGNKLRDGRTAPPDGEWLVHDESVDGHINICVNGLHASRNILDALGFAPGSTLCRVQLRGVIDEVEDKLVATKRRIVWRVDFEEGLRAFARYEALSVMHLWTPPDVVREFLLSGNESIRDAARMAAWDAWAAGAAAVAAWDAAWDARDAAWAAAGDAAGAARDAARDAAGAAAEDAWDAAWDAQEKTLCAFAREARSGVERWEFTV